MKLVRTIAMFTDHSYYGKPIETSRVELYVDSFYKPTDEELAMMKKNQEQRLLRMAKRMPHKFWHDHPELIAPSGEYEKPVLGYTLHKVT